MVFNGNQKEAPLGVPLFYKKSSPGFLAHMRETVFHKWLNILFFFSRRRVPIVGWFFEGKLKGDRCHFVGALSVEPIFRWSVFGLQIEHHFGDPGQVRATAFLRKQKSVDCTIGEYSQSHGQYIRHPAWHKGPHFVLAKRGTLKEAKCLFICCKSLPF